MFDLTGRKALVTGASGGIGEAIARQLHSQGAIVGLHGTRVERLEALAADLGDRVEMFPADLSDRDAVSALGKSAEEKLEGVDILVNNAGITKDGLFVRMSDDTWDQVMEVNLTAVFRLTRELMHPMMKRRNGRIINITSSSVQSGSAFQTHYTSSKGGLLAFTKCLAMALGEHGITANMIPPGSIDTPMLRSAEIMQKPGAIEAYGKALPVGRIGTGEDIAAAAAFLASEEAGYMTGQTISVNGGRYMGSA